MRRNDRIINNAGTARSGKTGKMQFQLLLQNISPYFLSIAQFPRGICLIFHYCSSDFFRKFPSSKRDLHIFHHKCPLKIVFETLRCKYSNNYSIFFDRDDLKLQIHQSKERSDEYWKVYFFSTG